MPIPPEVKRQKEHEAKTIFFQEYVDTLWPKQQSVFSSSAKQLLFGGAAGPGKSHVLRVAGIAWALTIPMLQVYLFRRTSPDLYKNHMEGPSSFPVMVEALVQRGIVKIHHSPPYKIFFSNGSRIHLVHMQHEKDKENIQGAEIHLALIDELTHFTKSQYAYIRARVRAVGLSLAAEYQKFFPRILCGSNPGSAGHNWVKQLFIDPAPEGQIWAAPPEEGGLSTQFIRALLSDNPSMEKDDPDYALRLQGLGDPALVKAMMEGDWDIVAGGMFDDIWTPQVHVLPAFEIPRTWTIYRAMDWGSSHPFSVGWWAKSDGTQAPNGQHYPRGSVFRIGEWYGWNGKPNEGLRMLAVEVGRGVITREKLMGLNGRVLAGPADAAMWAAENGVCIADDVARGGAVFIPSDKSPGSRQSGAEMMRKYLRASLESPKETPGLYVFESCRQFIRTIPVLPRDERNPDDVNSDAEDHVYDEARYFLMTPPREVGTLKVRGI